MAEHPLFTEVKRLVELQPGPAWTDKFRWHDTGDSGDYELQNLLYRMKPLTLEEWAELIDTNPRSDVSERVSPYLRRLERIVNLRDQQSAAK